MEKEINKMFNLFGQNITGENASGENIDFATLQKARKDLIGEVQAIIDYDEHIESSNNQTAKQVWMHIRNEELAHVGELLALIDYLAPYQKAFIEKGVQEFENTK